MESMESAFWVASINKGRHKIDSLFPIAFQIPKQNLKKSSMFLYNVVPLLGYS